MIGSMIGVIAGIAVGLALWPRRLRPTPGRQRRLAGRRLDLPGYRAKADAAKLERELAPVLDLICLAIGSGATISGSLRVVVDHGPRFSADRFAPLVADLDSGLEVEHVLRRLPEATGVMYQPVVTTLQTSLAHGSPLGELILRLGDEARSARRQTLDKRAKQTPVLLLFPLVACSLPALIVGAVVPLVMVSI